MELDIPMVIDEELPELGVPTSTELSGPPPAPPPVDLTENSPRTEEQSASEIATQEAMQTEVDSSVGRGIKRPAVLNEAEMIGGATSVAAGRKRRKLPTKSRVNIVWCFCGREEPGVDSWDQLDDELRERADVVACAKEGCETRWVRYLEFYCRRAC